MKITVIPGRYIVAVSGGVDSMVLIELLKNQKNLELVVAHFDHGIREDSREDEAFVQEYCKENNLPYVTDKVSLGPDASEKTARQARYAFLRRVREQQSADMIITAHHQDDVIETMMINLLRGTNRKGLSSLKSTATVLRPLLEYSKSEIKAYATQKQIAWREDSTNADEHYLRNYVRSRVLGTLSDEQRSFWVNTYHKMCDINSEIDQEIENLLQNREAIERTWLLQFPHKVACELLAAWLRKSGVQNISDRLIQDSVIFCKTSLPVAVHHIDKEHQLVIGKREITVTFRVNL